MIVDLLYASLGLVILLLAGDSLVKGAVNLALRLGIPALIVSLTVVAFGTSAPELLISVQAVLDGVPGLALGNVVGSNTANILLVLGIPALLKGLETKNCDSKRNYVQMMAASVLFIALAPAHLARDEDHRVLMKHLLVLLPVVLEGEDGGRSVKVLDGDLSPLRVVPA